MPQYRLTAQAEADLDSNWYFIARDNIHAANNLIETLLERFPLLAKRPMMGRPRPELGPDLRSIAVAAHLIAYPPTGFAIAMLYLRDSRRREAEPDDLFDAYLLPSSPPGYDRVGFVLA